MDTAPMKVYQGSKTMHRKTIAAKMAKPKVAKRKKTVAEDFPQEGALTGPASASY